MDHARQVDRHPAGQPAGYDLDLAIVRLARRQHGRVARRQLLALGLGSDAIDYRLGRSRLHVVHRGVYAVGHDAPTREGRWMAAVLAGGPDAVLSHRSAAALWGIRPDSGSPIEVTTPRRQHPRSGIRFHRSSLPRDEVTMSGGIPVTTVPRTLFDLAADLRPRQLERALGESEALRLWDRLSLTDLLRRYPRRKGSRAIRALLEARAVGATTTRSELEVLFLEFVDEAGFPQPETNAVVGGFEVDCVWRDRRIVIELDSRAFHTTFEAFERDRERDRILQTAGWQPVRITSRHLELTGDRLRSDLGKLLGLPGGSAQTGPKVEPSGVADRAA